jgi:uncharacterized lipoprotein YbaY
MRKITGTINPSNPGRPLEASSKVLIEVIDCSLAPAKVLGRTELGSLKKFPIKFKFEYDDAAMKKKPLGQYAITVSISTGDRIDYINDTRISVDDHFGKNSIQEEDGNLYFANNKDFDSIDIHVIPLM